MLLNKSYMAGATVGINLTNAPYIVGRVILGVIGTGWTGSVKPQKRVTGSSEAFQDCWWTDALTNTPQVAGTTLAASGIMDVQCDGCDLQFVLVTSAGSVQLAATQLAG